MVQGSRASVILTPDWLQTLHQGDFYQNCVPGATAETGPREPWHDIHARVEGPAARHVIRNFEDRWRRQNPDQAASLRALEDIDLEAAGGSTTAASPATPAPSTFCHFPLPWSRRPEEGEAESRAMEAEAEDAWSVQILRSIDENSAEFSCSEFGYENLNSKYGILSDNSIERAYIKLIRGSKSFVYIENQYFLGSAFSWQRESDAACQHCIPMELTQRIVSSITAGKEFKADM